jgi:hypothetical protein
MPTKITLQEIAERILDILVNDLKLKPKDARSRQRRRKS